MTKIFNLPEEHDDFKTYILRIYSGIGEQWLTYTSTIDYTPDFDKWLEKKYPETYHDHSRYKSPAKSENN